MDQITRRKELRFLMKKTLTEYLNIDNQINNLQKQIQDLKKVRNESEKTLTDIGNELNLETEKLRYHTDTINFSYHTPKQGLTNNIIRLSLETYLTSTNEWRQYSSDKLLELLLNKITEAKDTMSTTKKKNLKITRIANKIKNKD